MSMQSAAIAEFQERKEKYIEYLSELKNRGQTQLLYRLQRRMHSKDGFHSCYNVQTAVDGQPLWIMKSPTAIPTRDC